MMPNHSPDPTPAPGMTPAGQDSRLCADHCNVRHLQKLSSVILRQWKDSDFDPYSAMNTDPEVMRHFPAVLTGAQVCLSFTKLREVIEERGWGVWAVETEGAFAGMAGLWIPSFSAPFMPCTEILWRFRREYWGRGIAYAAAVQALAYGFSELRLTEIVAYTAASNIRSIRLMERLNFNRDLNGDFEHPGVPEGNPLRHHVLYRKMPNQSSEPTLASVTSPARQESRPR
jgi:RimJ/RimL family protein N-acetyltransferase